MRLARRANLTLLVAGLLLAAIAGSAAATTLDMSETTFRGVWRELTFTAAESSVTCPVTLEGTFLPESLGRIAKTAGNTMGRVTTTGVGTCTGGTVTALNETLPWSVKYSSFAGTLPNITTVTANVTGASFQVRPRSVEVSCLARTEASHPAGLTFERNTSAVITAARLNEASQIPLTGGFLCSFANGTMRGSASVTDAGSSTALELFLEAPPEPFGGTESRGPNDIIMREPVRIGQSIIKNYNMTDEIHNIMLEAEKPELFRVLNGATEDCSRAGLRLRPNQGNSCTIRVEYLGRPEQRTVSMIIHIEGKLGNNPASVGTILTVTAER